MTHQEILGRLQNAQIGSDPAHFELLPTFFEGELTEEELEEALEGMHDLGLLFFDGEIVILD